MDQRRLILFLVFSFALVMLWDGWLKHNQPPAPVAQQTPAGSASAQDGAVPTPTIGAATGQSAVPGEQGAAVAAAARAVGETDLLRAAGFHIEGWGQTLSQPLAGITHIEALRPGRGTGAFLVVAATRDDAAA